VWRNSQQGFTLLEVMIAISILAVALLALITFPSVAIMTSGRAQQISMATMLAQHQMAQALLDIEKEMGKGKLPDDRSDQGDFSDLGYPVMPDETRSFTTTALLELSPGPNDF